MFGYTPRLTSAAYGIIIILFFLPFINIKCNHTELENVKGIELATGFGIGNHSTDSSQQLINALDSVGASFHHNGKESNQAS